MPEPGREDPTARIIYNNDKEVQLKTVDIEDALETYARIDTDDITVGQIYNPETETMAQKWLIGFCNFRDAENFDTAHKGWFDDIEMDAEFGFKLTLGPCKSKPPPKEEKSNNRNRGRGRGRAPRGRGR